MVGSRDQCGRGDWLVANGIELVVVGCFVVSEQTEVQSCRKLTPASGIAATSPDLISVSCLCVSITRQYSYSRPTPLVM